MAQEDKYREQRKGGDVRCPNRVDIEYADSFVTRLVIFRLGGKPYHNCRAFSMLYEGVIKTQGRLRQLISGRNTGRPPSNSAFKVN